MIEFKKPEISDGEWVRDRFLKSGTVDCAYCFGNLIMWQEIYKIEICRIGDFFVSRAPKEDGGYCFCFPKGEGDVEEVISALESEFGGVCFFGLDENDKRLLEKIRPGKYEFISERDSADYIYSVEDLSDLPGKKYHQKRNHISFFEKTYNWSYEKINSANIEECMLMNLEWEKKNPDKLRTGTDLEEAAIKRAFENYERLGLVGGLLRVNSKVCAYTFGEKMNDFVFCTHVEKAFADIRGAYPMINREFAKNELSSFELVNREEDMGIEGLRKAKLSYHPKEIRAVFSAEIR